MAPRISGPVMLLASASASIGGPVILAGAWDVSKWQCTDSKCTQGCVLGDVERGSDTCEKLDADQSKRFDVRAVTSKGSCNSTYVSTEWWDTADCTVGEIGGGGGRSIGSCWERFDYEKLEYDGTYYIEKCSHVSHDIEVETDRVSTGAVAVQGTGGAGGCAALKAAVDKGPVKVPVAVDNMLKYYASGILTYGECTQATDEFIAESYEGDCGDGYFKLKVSNTDPFGPTFGEQGYVRMFMDDSTKGNRCIYTGSVDQTAVDVMV